MKTWLIVVLVALLAIGGGLGAFAASRSVETTANIEVRVWERVSDEALFLTYRGEGGRWQRYPNALDMSRVSNSGRFRTGTPVSLSVPVTVEVPIPEVPTPPTCAEQAADRPELCETIRPPMVPAYIDWYWGPTQSGFRTLRTDFTIHNDVGNWSDRYGYYLILLQNSISNAGFYFGLQTDANGRGKAVIFSRWKTRDLANARWSRSDGWTESSGHEGDFIGVRRTYDWGAGDYSIVIRPDGLDADGEWFGLWITDLASGEITWIGSLKFPLADSRARMRPHASATIELYGWSPVRPIDIPQWHVSVMRPYGDDVSAVGGQAHYPWDDSENALFNSDVRYDPAEDKVHLFVGGLTARRSAPGEVPAPDAPEVP